MSNTAVVLVDLAAQDPAVGRKRTWAAATDRERHDSLRFRRDQDRQDWLAARFALRKLVAVLADLRAEDVEVSTDPNGKPFIAGSPLAISLSRSGRWAALAVAPRSIGVDIEVPRPLPEAVDLALRFLHPSDAAAIADADDPERTFYLAWVRLEALLKCRGTGFAGEPTPTVLSSGRPEGQTFDIGLGSALGPKRPVGAFCLQSGRRRRPDAGPDRSVDGLVRVVGIDEMHRIACREQLETVDRREVLVTPANVHTDRLVGTGSS